MNSPARLWRRLALTIVVTMCLYGAVQAQATNPNGTPYPYWDTAPQGFRGSQVTVPVPGISPNMISNAAQSPGTSTSLGRIGGGYVPPFLTVKELALPKRQSPDADNKAHIWLRVPENAEVWVDGVKTKQSGETRYYFSPPLAPGKKYAYQMKVRWVQDGKPVEDTQRFIVQAGDTIRRDFTRSR
ncbi:MAG TPA: TIGR03000 domain-containing protein [Gemmataceae bacterium]|nr:TIGR03000 domain-containing protein [Gemmataceae bacterium]